jgi:SPP1 gp7 family putative phage head morphogenesis protein
VTEVTVANVPAREAIEHLREKLKLPARSADSFLGAIHAKAFTVAGATKMDLINDLHGAVASVMESGGTITDFRKQFDEIVARHGWAYRGARGWRTGVMFNTNLRTAHAAGRWKQIERVKKARPWLVYSTVDDSRVRPEHRAWHNLALPVDDPWWDSHYPPNGWGCRCSVISASDAQLKRWGIQPAKAPAIESTRRVNTSTGVDYGQVPLGIDPGWDYNVGKAWLGSDVAFGERLMAVTPAIREQVLGNVAEHLVQLSRSWGAWLVENAGKPARGYAHTVGYLPLPLINHLVATGRPPKGATIVVFDRQTNHLSGSHKDARKRFPEAWLRDLPLRLQDYQAIVQHGDEYIIVLKSAVGNKQGRAVIAVDFSRKGARMNNIRSLSILDVTSLKQAGYELIDGKL